MCQSTTKSTTRHKQARTLTLKRDQGLCETEGQGVEQDGREKKAVRSAV